MIIILEGCDAVGKTTFANRLSEKMGFEIVKGSSFDISKLGADGMFDHMMRLLDRDNIIIDRFFYSNLVYGKLYNYPMMTKRQYVELAVKSRKSSITIYLNAYPDEIKNRISMRGDDMIKSEEIDNILNEYNSVMNGVHKPRTMLSLDTTVSDFNMLSELVKDFVNQDSTKIYTKM